MFSKKKNPSKLDSEQRELYENARRRTLQKKRLFQHFVVFLVGAVLLIVVNVVIGYKEEFTPLGYNWFVWAILIWTFFFLIHLINVFVTSSFMGKEWEQKQMENLVRKQRERIEELDRKVKKDHPAPTKNPDPAPAREEPPSPGIPTIH
ncbi:2TM domain-containing protein [Antarcticibacterium flavum]|uniref:2TM domain-containing protein n=1 Tax=Antarcticibacterium flavum TaxID=2058175 RepID=A0A5B7X131_9FLAO|nr:2TM domain-containing protein [Antarcticibacterium flavum]QCY68970.1 2TM domain-containing protein [Antarcticibacterium flavum]